MDDFSAKLKTMQSNYAAAKTQQEQMFGGAPVDPGVYEGRLSKCELKLSKKGSLQIMRSHIITSAGDFEGIPVRDYMNLETEYGFAFARRWVEICGFQCPDKVTDFKNTIEEMSSSKVQVRFEVRRDGDFTNVSVIEKLGGTDDTADDTPEEITSDDAGEPEVDENLAKLQAFAASQDIEISDDDDIDTVKEKISAFNYEHDKLTPEEIDTLNENELGDLIQKPAPKKVPAKAPVKKPLPKGRK